MSNHENSEEPKELPKLIQMAEGMVRRFYSQQSVVNEFGEVEVYEVYTAAKDEVRDVLILTEVGSAELMVNLIRQTTAQPRDLYAVRDGGHGGTWNEFFDSVSNDIVLYEASLIQPEILVHSSYRAAEFEV